MVDLGLKLIEKSKNKGLLNKLGLLLVKTLPIVIKKFSVLSTIALILVSGGIFALNIDYLHHFLPTWPSIEKEFAFGVLGGLMALVLLVGGKKIFMLIKK